MEIAANYVCAGFSEGWYRSPAGNVYRSAVEVFGDAQHYCLVLRDAFDFVAPFSGNLHGRLYRLCSRVHGQYHVKTKELGDELGELGEDIVVEGS